MAAEAGAQLCPLAFDVIRPSLVRESDDRNIQSQQTQQIGYKLSRLACSRASGGFPFALSSRVLAAQWAGEGVRSRHP